jgi:hypothetical protein
MALKKGGENVRGGVLASDAFSLSEIASIPSKILESTPFYNPEDP